MFSEGFDLTLQDGLQADWIAVPRRYSLDPENWAPREKKEVDYMFLCYPNDPNDFGGPSLKGRVWNEWNNSYEKQAIPVDDLMSSQGSSWFMHRTYFHWLELLDEASYGHFSNEFQEIGLKCWLSGGRVVVDKRCWYAHLHKGQKYGRGWPLGKTVLDQGARFTNQWMDGRNWHRQDRDIRWMVNKFWPVPTWPEEAVRLVFHRRRGESGQVRGLQMAQYFKARLDPAEWRYDFDVHVWVKMEPEHVEWPGRHYLDVIDEPRRIPWLREHPECGVIAMSLSGQEYLQEQLGRDDVLFIPVHHCNFGRARRAEREMQVAGVVGGQGAIQCDVAELEAVLNRQGLEFRWLQDYKTPEEIVAFYQTIDVQIVWRPMQRPLKEPLKIVNAMSLGIPTVAYPEPAYQEVEGYYWPVTNHAQLAASIEELKRGFDAQRLVDKAEEYHIDNVAKLYRGLLA
jgi:hypothetical protein